MIRDLFRPAAAGAVVLGVFVLSACGPREEKLHRVSGQVTFAGKPVPKGYIRFTPTGDGPMGYANILDGRYDTAEGSGVRGGSYSVSVGGFDGKPVSDLPFGHPLFLEFSGTKDLPAEDSTYDLDIPKNR